MQGFTRRPRRSASKFEYGGWSLICLQRFQIHIHQPTIKELSRIFNHLIQCTPLFFILRRLVPICNILAVDKNQTTRSNALRLVFSTSSSNSSSSIQTFIQSFTFLSKRVSVVSVDGIWLVVVCNDGLQKTLCVPFRIKHKPNVILIMFFKESKSW